MARVHRKPGARPRLCCELFELSFWGTLFLVRSEVFHDMYNLSPFFLRTDAKRHGSKRNESEQMLAL